MRIRNLRKIKVREFRLIHSISGENDLEIKKTSEKYNPLLKRKELTFLVNHASSATPRLFEVRKALATMYGVNEEVVYITKLNTLTGTNQMKGEAGVYDSPERAKLLVPRYIQSRNLPNRGKGKVEKEKD